ncbi:beta-hydroxyacyl-ACP dehydratase [Massilia sp. Dwa41.01b]|uniref:3-hydroxyacyl-ACP dehydratase FabZ family protein n=1 Tax=unclassified Massilia TaxID=2609279 RepID=UPI00160339CE|nr:MULTISPECIES: 3-hydroxyacyl-ACP dehydratase FabZ family protein [unclassified Massilia]QNA87320.1 beta-hydroxyacyl-ACP dehydratase [Massilia sp. Dwa41.01b]QNA98227.1 beta-hydroxyacyl-ACP dehydratase [Massilia sp. Se16.2.3]
MSAHLALQSGNADPVDVRRIDVKSLIPHREPFLLVDALGAYLPGESLDAVKAVSRAEPWFQGHFPDFPVMPGVLVTEALAQTCAMFMALEARRAASPPDPDDIYILLRTEVRNTRPVFPGTLLQLRVDVDERLGEFVHFKVLASQGGKSCVRGRLTVGKASKSKLEQ